MECFDIWKPVELEIGACASWELGNLQLWTERYETEWHLLPVHGEGTGAAEPRFTIREKAEKPESSEWKHYLLRDGPWATPLPAMMDRSLVIRPDRTLILIPGERARFFISLPVWFSLFIGKTAGTESGRKLQEYPAAPLANAWFGDPVSGELCYFIAARLYPELDQVPLSPVHAVCPLLISNESDRELSFDRICLHTEFLAVYRSPSRFWTNEVSVVFRGIDQETRLQPSRHAPDLDGATTLVTRSRRVIENWYFKKTFGFLKQFTGL